MCQNFIFAMAGDQEDAGDHSFDDFPYRVVPVWTPTIHRCLNPYEDNLATVAIPMTRQTSILKHTQALEALQKGW